MWNLREIDNAVSVIIYMPNQATLLNYQLSQTGTTT